MTKRKPNEYLGSEKLDDHLWFCDTIRLGSKLFEELFLNTKDPLGFYQHVIETEKSYKPKENEGSIKMLDSRLF